MEKHLSPSISLVAKHTSPQQVRQELHNSVLFLVRFAQARQSSSPSPSPSRNVSLITNALCFAGYLGGRGRSLTRGAGGPRGIRGRGAVPAGGGEAHAGAARGAHGDHEVSRKQAGTSSLFPIHHPAPRPPRPPRPSDVSAGCFFLSLALRRISCCLGYNSCRVVSCRVPLVCRVGMNHRQRAQQTSRQQRDDTTATRWKKGTSGPSPPSKTSRTSRPRPRT